MFERVYTMTDYYDGPREGVADFHGAPHAYRRLFIPSEDRESDLFELSELTHEAFAHAIEAWDIWCRFESAMARDPALLSTPPVAWGALPDELARYQALQVVIAEERADVTRVRFVCRGRFRPRPPTPSTPPPFTQAPLEAEWTLQV